MIDSIAGTHSFTALGMLDMVLNSTNIYNAHSIGHTFIFPLFLLEHVLSLLGVSFLSRPLFTSQRNERR